MQYRNTHTHYSYADLNKEIAIFIANCYNAATTQLLIILNCSSVDVHRKLVAQSAILHAHMNQGYKWCTCTQMHFQFKNDLVHLCPCLSIQSLILVGISVSDFIAGPPLLVQIGAECIASTQLVQGYNCESHHCTNQLSYAYYMNAP